MSQNGENRPSRLGAVMFGRDDDVDAAIRAFVETARASGARVAGFVQERIDGGDDVRMRDIETGAELAIMQDLGPGAEGCRLDPAAVAVAAASIGRALARSPDLVVVNRFGKLESEGGGLLAELAEAVAMGVPALVAVPLRLRAAWAGLAGGLDVELAPARDAIEDWWRGMGRNMAS